MSRAGVRLLFIPILTVGTPAVEFYYIYYPPQLGSQLRLTQAIPRLGYKLRHLDYQTSFLQALPRLGYIPCHLVLLQRLPHALPRLRLQRPQT